MPSQVLQLGPLVLPWAAVIAFCAWLAGSMTYDRLSARQGLAVGRHAWALALLAFAAARLGFVLQYLPQYLQAPLSVVDIRDGGWSPAWGLIAAAVGGLVLWWRRSAWRRPVAAGLAAGAAAWLAGTGLWWALQPTAPAGLPAWQGVALDARTVHLPSALGRPMVINLWASWCPPCRREMPVLLRAYEAHKDVLFLWVNQGETPELAARFAASWRLPATKVVLDTSAQLGSLLGHKALPTTLFYNAQGQLVAVRSGELSEATLAQHLERIRQPDRR